MEQIIANPEEMKRVMNYATEQEFQLMLRIAADEDLSNCTIEHDLYQYFAKNGYFYLVEEKKQVAYAMPLIIKEIFHKINTAKYRKERDEFQKFGDTVLRVPICTAQSHLRKYLNYIKSITARLLPQNKLLRL